MLLPPLREEGDVREQVNRGLKDIERVITAKIVKAVPRVAALNVAAIALPHGIQPALMPMTGNAVFIESDEHGVVVFLCPVPGSFTAFVDELLAHEGIEYLTVDATLFQQVGIHTAHRVALRWECEGLCRLRLLLLCRRVASAEIIAEEQRHGVRVAESIELLSVRDPHGHPPCVPSPYASPAICGDASCRSAFLHRWQAGRRSRGICGSSDGASEG